MIIKILLSPLLLLRQILLTLLSFSFLLGLLLYLIASTSFLLHLIALFFLSTFYQISFSDLKGNLFTGISLNNLSIKDKIVSKNIDIQWDLSKINKKKITIKSLNIKKLDKDNLLQLLSTFESNQTSTPEKKKKLDKGFEVLLVSSNISIADFKEKNISIKKSYISFKNLSFYDNTIEIPKINIESNVSINSNLFVAIKSSHHRLLYRVDTNYIELNSTVKLESNYSKEIEIKNTLRFDKSIYYRGIVETHQIILDKNLTKYRHYIKNTKLSYEANKTNLEINLSNDYIKSKINMYEYKQINIELNTSKEIYLDDFIEKIPKEINNTKVFVKLKGNYNIETKIGKAQVDINSSLMTIFNSINYANILDINSILRIRKDSKLKNIDKNIVWKNLSNFEVNSKINIEKKLINLRLTSPYLKANASYNHQDSSLYTKVNLENFFIEMKGKLNGTLSMDKSINIDKILKSSHKYYRLKEKPKVKGKIRIKAKLEKLKKLDVILSSKNIVYKNSKKDKISLSDIYLIFSKTGTELTLKNYHLKYDDFYLFSTKPSYFTLYKDRFISHFFLINDDGKLFVDYNLTTKKGEMTLESQNFAISQKIVHSNIKSTIKGTIDNNITNITGDVSILNGNIFYNLNRKRFNTSKDIIILQHHKKKSINFFKDFVFIDVNVKTQKPLVYKEKNINLSIDTDIKIFKALKMNINILGTVKIRKNGFYIIKNKKFTFKNSRLYFVGETSNTKLEIELEYKNANYIIKISVRGDVSNPIITFSSNANLSQAEILSVILFDSSTGGDNSDTSELLKMIGGALAKSILANIGIKLDYLVFGSNNRVEIGTEIVKGLTIIYVNDEVSSIKLQYQHNAYTTSTIKVNNEVQSADIVFKKRFDKF